MKKNEWISDCTYYLKFEFVQVWVYTQLACKLMDISIIKKMCIFLNVHKLLIFFTSSIITT